MKFINYEDLIEGEIYVGNVSECRTSSRWLFKYCPVNKEEFYGDVLHHLGPVIHLTKNKTEIIENADLYAMHSGWQFSLPTLEQKNLLNNVYEIY